ncbi:hypothetical protein XENTR_v10005502 [Xenopus tropicalis]|nr:hypothetical protein XENTR_v10005502 [Xenopus tropicalis]
MYMYLSNIACFDYIHVLYSLMKQVRIPGPPQPSQLHRSIINNVCSLLQAVYFLVNQSVWAHVSLEVWDILYCQGFVQIATTNKIHVVLMQKMQFIQK